MKCGDCKREYDATGKPLCCSQDWDGKTWLCQKCEFDRVSKRNVEQPVVSEPDWEALARVYKKREFKLAVEHKRLRESMHKVAAESDQFGLDPKLDDKPWERLGLIHRIARHALEGESVTPRYQHDCNTCIFVGRGKYHHDGQETTTNVDLYVCPQQGIPTAVARFGDDGPEYMSGQRILERVELKEF